MLAPRHFGRTTKEDHWPGDNIVNGIEESSQTASWNRGVLLEVEIRLVMTLITAHYAIFQIFDQIVNCGETWEEMIVLKLQQGVELAFHMFISRRLENTRQTDGARHKTTRLDGVTKWRIGNSRIEISREKKIFLQKIRAKILVKNDTYFHTKKSFPEQKKMYREK